ncbi:hypothetical protein C0J52_24138, partial [Blattella germanica]
SHINLLARLDTPAHSAWLHLEHDRHFNHTSFAFERYGLDCYPARWLVKRLLFPPVTMSIVKVPAFTPTQYRVIFFLIYITLRLLNA